jgi:hydrogenase/urease accessory protein HupE
MAMVRILNLRFWLWCAMVLVSRPAWAHDPGLSSATIILSEANLEALLVFSTLDIGQIVELDMNRNGNLSAEELKQAGAELNRVRPGALDVELNGIAVKAAESHCRFDSNNNTTVHLNFPMTSFTNLVIRSRWLTNFPPGHRQHLLLQNPNGVDLAQRMLTADADSVTIELDAPPSAGQSALAASPQTNAPSAGPRMVNADKSSFGPFLRLGVEHILTGYDHLLFLLGLLIVARTFASSLAIITSFTIAHSITLAVATLDLIQIPGRIIEPLIAGTIVYVGLENLFRNDDPKGRWLLTFAFGLIHGFGFASVLREIGVGRDGSGIALPLLSFNLGVELGQVAVAALLLPLIWSLRNKAVFTKRWVSACSVLVAALGAYWFVQRVWF